MSFKLDKKVRNKLMLIGIILMLLGLLIVLVSALTLEDEVSQLENSLSSQGYSWLVDYNLSYPSVGVYRENDNQLLAQFPSIIGGEFNKYQIFLTNLSDNESYATFDLKSTCSASTIMGGDGNFSDGDCSGVDYDYVVDPTTGEEVQLCDQGDNNTVCNITTSHLNISDGAVFYFNNLNIKQGGSLANMTANCSGTSHGCGFSLVLTGNLTIFPGGNITAGNISITAANVNVQANSTKTGMIITDGLGWMGPAYTGSSQAGIGPGKGDTSGGGSYGGLGSSGSGSTGYFQSLNNWIYGNATQPVDFGSSGGCFASYCNSIGGAGAGIIFINATGTLSVGGIISSGGATGVSYSGGGSGGSVLIVANNISGNGNLSATGGVGPSGGGGGGRIALNYNTSVSDYNLSKINLAGGAYSTKRGNAGTLSFPDNQNWTIFYDAALAPGNYNIPYLVVANNATLYFEGDNSTANGTGVRINSVNVQLNSGARIYGDGIGFKGGNSPVSEGPGGGMNNIYLGASHGGLGGAQTNMSKIYGSETYPTSLGSGGYTFYNTIQQASGGSAIYINASGNVTINGNISANGEQFVYEYTGGASGGSILIVASNILGNGTVSALGGYSGGADGMSGGGGRIALHASIINLPSLIENKGGVAPTGVTKTGSAGTIYINATTSITSSGNITATGYNGTTARLNVTAPSMIMSGIYNLTSTVNPQGITTLNYSSCSNSQLTGTFTPAYVKASGCASCSGSYTVTITLPANNTYFNTSNVGSFNVSTSLYSTSCLLSLNGGTNVTMTGNSSSTGFNATNSSIGDGSYNATVFCSDSLGDTAISIINFNVDITYPQINFTSPTPANNAYQNINNLFVNVSVTETNPSNITFYLYNNTNTLTLVNSTIFTMASQTANNTINWTLSADAVYYYNVTITDKANNINKTETRTFTRDNTYPSVNITYPLNITYNINVSALNYTTSDTNLQACIYSTNNGGANSTIATCGANLTGLTSTEGTNTWLVSVNDSSGNLNLSRITFFKDTIFPQISFGAGTADNNSYLSQSNIYVNVSVTETNENTIIFYLYNNTNTLTLVNSTSYTNSARTINWTGLTDTIYYYNVSVNDTGNNRNTTELRKITLDTTLPQINYSSPTENDYANKSQNWIFVNVSVVDVNYQNITFNLYNNGVEVNITSYSLIDAVSNTTINWTGFSDSNAYTYYVNITDKANNKNSTLIRHITLDIASPGIAVTYPSVMNYSVNVSQLNYTRSDATAGLFGCWYSLNDGVANSSFDATCGNYSGLTSNEGWNNWTVYANDSSGNANYSRVTFFKDTIYPLIDFGAGTENNATNFSRNWIFVNVSVTETNPVNITFKLYNMTSIVNSTTYSMSSQTANNTINFTSLTDINYYSYNATICDALNLCNSTSTRTITLDTTPPAITINYPLNTTTHYVATLPINVTAIDAIMGIQSCWHHIDSDALNYTLTMYNATFYNATYTIAHGYHNITVWCNDTLNNVNSTTMSNFNIVLADLTVSDVTIPETIYSQNSTLIVTNISNLGPPSVTGVNVSCYANNTIAYSRVISAISGLSSYITNCTVNFNGMYNQWLNVSVDPANSIPESNENNNNYSRLVNATTAVNIGISSPATANTTEVINVNGRMIGNDNSEVSSKLFVMKLNNVLVSSDTLNHSNFTAGSGTDVNISNVVQLNLTSESGFSLYSDDYSTTKYTTDAQNYNSLGYDTIGREAIFSLNDMGLPSLPVGNITYKFTSLTKFYNASVVVSTLGGGGNTSMWYSLNNVSWTILNSTTGEVSMTGRIPVNSNTFYVMVKSNTNNGAYENPVTYFAVNYSSWDYANSGNFASGNISLPNVTYTTLKWVYSGTGSIKIQLRESDDAITWGAWGANYTNYLGNDISAFTKTYLQYRAWLSAANLSLTPILNAVQIMYFNAVTNSTGGYNYNVTIPTDSLGILPFAVSINQSFSTSSFLGSNQTNIAVWAGTSSVYFTVKNYSGESNYSVFVNFTRSDTGNTVNGTIKANISNSTMSSMKTCNGNSCAFSWLIPTELSYGNYTVNISAYNESAYYRNSSAGFGDYLEEKNTTGNIYSGNRTLLDYNPAASYPFYWNVTVNNSGKASMNNVHVWAEDKHGNIQSVSEVTPCSKVYPATSCNALMLITVGAGAGVLPTPNKFITWRANWTDNDGTISGGSGYVQFISYVILSLNANVSLSNYSINKTMQHASNDSFSFIVQSTGTDSVTQINISLIEETLPASWINFSTNWIPGLSGGQTYSMTGAINVPAQTSPGNYSGIVNVSSSNAGERHLNLTVSVPLNGSWYVSPSTNLSYSRSFSLNTAGEIGNYTIVNLGNINMTFNISYSNGRTTDYTSKPGLFIIDTSGMNPTKINVSKGENSTIILYQSGWSASLSDVGVNFKMYNETASPTTLNMQETFSIFQQPPNVTGAWFILDSSYGNIAEVNKNLTIKIRGRDDVNLNETATIVNATLGGTTYTLNASTFGCPFGECDGSENARTVANFTANFTPTSEGNYSVIATVYNTNAGNVQSYTSSAYYFYAYGITALNVSSNVSEVNISSINKGNKSVLYFNISINNTGSVYAYSPYLNFSGNESIRGINYTFADISSGSKLSYTSQVNVSELTPPGTYNLTAIVRWRNPDNSNSSSSINITIRVLSNKSFIYSPNLLNYTLIPGSSNSTIITINNTGNDVLSGMGFSFLSGTIYTGFTLTGNETSFSIARNSSRNINLTLTAQSGLDGGDYSGVVNISEQNISRTINIYATVPESLTWSATPLAISSTKAVSSSGNLGEVTISNTGNVNITFTLASNDSAMIASNVSSILVQKSSQAKFMLTYNSSADEGTYYAIISITNLSANPVQTNVSINLTTTRLGVSILSPTALSPLSNVSAGNTIEIHANATYGDTILTNNSNWSASVGGSACSGLVSSFASGFWNITCSAPSISDGVAHNLTLTLTHNIYGERSQTEEGAIIYRDTSPPSFNITRNHINKGANINLHVNISDNVNVSLASAALTYPNGSKSNISLSLSSGFYINNSVTLNDAGEYIVNYSANDTTGNWNSTVDWFEVYDRYNWILALSDYAGTAVSGVNITLLRPNATTILLNNITGSNGAASFYVNKRFYDMKVAISSDELYARNINFTNLTQSGIYFNAYRIASEGLSETVALHNVFQGIVSNSTNLTGNSVNAVFNYSGAGYRTRSQLEVVKCSSWNFTTRACAGGWSLISSSINTDTLAVQGNSTGVSTSAYFLAENTCGTNGCELGYGETTSTCSADCKETTVIITGGSSGGGGGGGGLAAGDLKKIEEIVKSFLDIGGVKLETTSIYKEMFAGDTASFRIKLKNTLATPTKITMSADGDIKDFIFFETNVVELKASEMRDVLIKIVAPKTVSPGNYDGDLILKSGDKEGKVPVTIRILSPEGKLLDVKIQPLAQTVAPGGILKLQTDLLNMGKASRVDVQFDLQLLDIETGEIITRKEEAFSVETSLSVVKNLTIPEDTKTGKYMVKAVAYYSNVEQAVMQASSIAYVNVDYPLFMRNLFGVKIWIYFLVLALLGAGVGAFYYARWMDYRKRRFRVKVEINKLPQAGENTAFVGKIAETGIRAFTDLNKLQMHTLIAGATGSGKTVAAQDMVEAALLHNKSVIVFDPTAQWTGFLRKCEDRGMLKRYHYFDMNEKEAKAFNGIIKTIHDPYEMIDIKKYMNKPGEITIFNISHLTPKEIDVVVASTIEQIFASEPEENRELKNLIVYDEVHRLLPKFGGSGAGFIQLERGAREFRKWGIGLVLISQVLSDFVGEVKANIGTEVQMGTRYEGDLERVNMKYGEDVLKSVVKEPIGTGMVVNAEYNLGRPYFVSFRPMLHSTRRLSNEELVKYEKYFSEIEDIEYQLEKLKEFKIDVFDIELEIKLAKGKVKEGQFQMADMYLEGLRPRVAEHWKKLNKTPVHMVIKKISKEEVKVGIETAQKEREKYIKKNPQEEISLEQELLNLKRGIEDKKKEGKKTSELENKLEDLNKRLKGMKGKLSKEDSEGIKKEVEALKLEIQKL